MADNERTSSDVSYWIGRGLSILLFLLLGAFFLDHTLPLFNGVEVEGLKYLWLVQGIHVLLLIGYLISLKFEVVGSLFILIFGGAFFVLTANGASLWLFLIISFSPTLFYLYGWLRKNRMEITDED